MKMRAKQQRPVVVLPIAMQPRLFMSFHEAIDALGESWGALLHEAFVGDSGHNGVWVVPHPESQDSITVNLRDFSTSPGPRYMMDGEKSGEEWGRKVLVPAHRSARERGCTLIVDLSGVRGIGYGFLHEAFRLVGRSESLTNDFVDVVVRCPEEPEIEAEAYEALAQGFEPPSDE